MSIEKRWLKRTKKWAYDVRLRTPGGTQVCKTFRTRRAAEAFEAAQRTELAGDTWIDPRRGDARFADVAAEWLASNPAKQESTWARDESIIRLHLDPAIGTAKVGRITPALVQRLVHTWSAAMAANTARRHYCTLRAILNYAVSAELIGRSPCRGIRLPPPPRPSPQVVSPHDLATLASRVGPRYEAMVYVAGILGLRWGECAGLRVQNLDFDESRLTVAEQLGPLLHGRRGMRPPKSAAGVRTMAVPRELMTRLQQHLVAHGTREEDAMAFVFPGPGGRPLSYASFRERVWNPACVAVGLGRWTLTPVNSKTRRRYAGLTFHDLRDSASTALVVSGVDPKTTQVRMGHADIRTTLSIYARATRESDRGASDALAKYFLDGGPSAMLKENDHCG